MKKILGLLLSAALLSCLLCGCGPARMEEELKVIGVVAKGQNDAFWQMVLAGAEDAASENGYAITFRGPEGTEDVREQRDMVELALENDVVGLVLAAMGPGYEDLLGQAWERGIPVVQFDSGIWSQDVIALNARRTNPLVSSVSTGNEEAGALAADHLFARVREDIAAAEKPYVVGIIQHDLSVSGRDRADGFTQRLKQLTEENPQTRGKCRICREIRLRDTNDAYAKALDSLQRQEARAVFMTNERVVNQVRDQILKSGDKYDSMLFVGFDSGIRQLQWLRSGELPELIGSVTQDAYQIGYRAVTQCINAMEARGVTAFIRLPGTWYDRDNMASMMAMDLLEQ